MVVSDAVYGIGIESSCDETSISLIKNGREIITNEIISQMDFHALYGGVIPESASRLHLEKASPLLESALNALKISGGQLGYIAVTTRPGLVGPLLVGYYTALAAGYVYQVPVIPVHHLEAHFYAPLLEQKEIRYPFAGLLLSGGNSTIFHVHNLGSWKVLGDTLDDACGEALDKGATMMGLNYPGGPELEKQSNLFYQKQNEKKSTPQNKVIAPRNPFPKILADQKGENYNFSYSGLKTSLYYYLEKNRENNDALPVEALCAFYQERAFEIVERNIDHVLSQNIYKQLVAAGGVLANKTLKKKLAAVCEKNSVEFIAPSPALCTDNGAMVGALGYQYFKKGSWPDISTGVSSSKSWDVLL